MSLVDIVKDLSDGKLDGFLNLTDDIIGIIKATEHNIIILSILNDNFFYRQDILIMNHHILQRLALAIMKLLVG